MPLWTDNLLEPGGDFEFLSLNRYLALTFTTGMKTIQSGYMLKEILDRFTNKTQSTLTPNRSVWMNFGHDTTIANMLSTLGLFEVH